MPKLLKEETSSRAANVVYIDFYAKKPLLIDWLRFVRDSYKEVFTEILLDDDTRVGFLQGKPKGCLFGKGSYLTRSAESHAVVAQRYWLPSPTTGR